MRERKITIHTTSDGQTTIVYDLVDPKDGGLVTRRSATLKTFHAIDYPGLFYNIKKLITDFPLVSIHPVRSEWADFR